MGINWSEKNTAELEIFFSTNIKKGLTREQYLRAKFRYGENIINSEILEQQNFYGLRKKKRNIKAMLSGSFGIIGVIYFLTMITLNIMEFDVRLYIFIPFYIFLAVSAFILSGNSEKKYGYLYKIARPKALVIRQNKRKKVFIESIVPGDVILLSAGDIVPADARLVFADYLSCLRTNGSGGIEKMEKTARVINGGAADNKTMSANIVYAADIVDSGNASAVVIATGKNTYIANIYEKDGADGISPDINKQDMPGEYSFMQKCANKISRDIFLSSVFFSMIIIFSGIMQERDFITVILTCLTVSAASFSEQIPIIADYAVIYGMHRLSKLGILVKETSIIDEINAIDMIIAKKNESFTQGKMELKKISDFDIAIENSSEIGYILSCMTLCSNVTAYGRRNNNKTVYSGEAIDVAVFEALNKCGLSYDAVCQVYQKISKTIYNPKNGIKSAVILKDGGFSLVCFGEAGNILERCVRINDGRMRRIFALDRRGLNFYREKMDDLYKKYDLVMAVAAKDLTRKYAYGAELETELDFLGFACFSEPKTSEVFESINYLKKSGVNPVMMADSDSAYTRSAAVKFGISPNHSSAYILDDFKINRMGDSMFFINADKFRLFTPIALGNRIKLLRALKFKKKFPAVTVNDIEEISLLNESCVAFTSVNTETGILKNKASVITKNLTVSTVLKTVKNAVLIFRNICGIAHFSYMMFISQYLMILFAVALNGAYILNPLQIIWGGAGVGYALTVSICLNEENAKWHILRNKIKKYKNVKKFNNTVLKYGFIYGFLIAVSAAASFLICFAIKDSLSFTDVFKKYINSHSASSGVSELTVKSAQLAAFISYIVSCISISLNYIKGRRFFDMKLLKNKIFIYVFTVNLLAVIFAVSIPVVRDFLDFGEIDAKIFAVSALIGLCPRIITIFLRERIFFGQK